jgi:hypothetical protein
VQTIVLEQSLPPSQMIISGAQSLAIEVVK